ncbi:discoidin domain-containing protein [Lentzea sp. NPDC058450]|uniref:discoidin domain-containing protein n=1 Tax=Lentzea sp. NPDC058450 TaxID=3346505 RepID=UPI0036569DA9
MLTLGVLASMLVAVASPARAADITVERWRSGELVLTAAQAYADPLTGVQVNATFAGPGGTVLTRPAFWDGGNTWKVRFAPTRTGLWTMTTSASNTADSGLHNVVRTVDAVPYAGSLEIYQRGFLKKSADGHHLTYADGTPFFWLGDTHWIMPHERFSTSNAPGVASQFKYTVDKRVEQGFTVFQSEPIWQPHGGTHTGPDEEPVADLTNGFSAADLPGFANLDRKFAYVADKGLLHANAQITWARDPANFPVFTDAFMAAMARYWVARFGAYPSVWTLAQEIDKNHYNTYNSTTLSKWYAVGDTIAATDAYQHPLMPHQEHTGSTNVPDSTFAGRPWHTGFAAQIIDKGNWNKTIAKRYWDVAPAKPALAYETSYEDLVFSADHNMALSAGYKAFQLGYFGYGFGVNGVWNDIYSAPGQPLDAGTDYLINQDGYSWWYDGANTPTGPRLTHFKNFYKSFDWWLQTPRFDDAAWGTVGAGGYLSSNGNNNYVALFANTSTETGVLRQMDDNAHYRAVWFDPRTGSYQTISNTVVSSGGAWTIPPKPGDSDWVLRVTKQGARASVTGAPTASLAATDLNGSAQVRLTTETGGATIRYTVDGSTPTGSSTVYTGPITIAGTTAVTVRAQATSAGRTASSVMTETYPARRGLTQGATYSASSQWDANQGAARAFDGDAGTNWQACNGCWSGQWLEANFGGNRTVSQVTVSEYDNRTTGYRVEYWTGSAWATAYTGTGGFGTTGQSKAISFPAVTTSRLRLFFTSGTANAPIIYEFGAFDPPANFARTATMAASSTFNGDQTAAKGGDGDLGTNWQACGGCAGPQWLEANFGTPRTFNQVTVSEFGSRTRTFRVEYWNGSGWSTAYTGNTPFGEFRAVHFPAVTATSVRVVFLTWEGTAPIVYELGVHSTLSPTLTTGASFSSSSNYAAGQAAAQAFDGSLATNWQAADGRYRGEWLQADFGANRTFSKVSLSEYGARTSGFRIEYWNGSSWQTAFTGSTPLDQYREISFPAVTGSRVRLHFTSRTLIQPIIYEFGVHA